MYPSVTRDNIVPDAVLLKINSKKAMIFPSNYATCGFDVTLIPWMRMAQEVKFEQTVNAVATEQVESKFEYL
jgi:hypothetical protein